MVLNELAGDAWKAAQMSVIGALLLWPDDLSGKIFRAAKPTYFSDSTLRHLFEAAQGLWFDRKPIDPVTVLHAAGMDGHQETVSACMQAVPTRANIDEHLHILHDEARLYQIRMAASELAWCKSEGEALEAYERMGQLRRETDTIEDLSWEELVNDYLDRMQDPSTGLEESIRCYEEGMHYYRICTDILHDAKQQIETYRIGPEETDR